MGCRAPRSGRVEQRECMGKERSAVETEGERESDKCDKVMI